MINTPESRAIISEAMDRETLAMWFEALDDLRESGQINMGASANVLENSGLERKVAKAVSRAWMATFDPDAPMERRVEESYSEVYNLLAN